MPNNEIKLKLCNPDLGNPLELPLTTSVSAGFPSAAEDFIEGSIDLNKLLIKHPAATFYVWVSGDSMLGDHIQDGDLLVVDRALRPGDGDIAMCYLDGEFTLKRIKLEQGRIFLMPSNEKYKPIEVGEGDDFTVWGLVRASITLYAR